MGISPLSSDRPAGPGRWPRQVASDHSRGSYGTGGMFAGGLSISLVRPRPHPAPHRPPCLQPCTP